MASRGSDGLYLARRAANKHARDAQSVMDEVEFGVGDVFNGGVRRRLKQLSPIEARCRAARDLKCR
jgi:hypothetical protein